MTDIRPCVGTLWHGLTSKYKHNLMGYWIKYHGDLPKFHLQFSIPIKSLWSITFAELTILYIDNSVINSKFLPY